MLSLYYPLSFVIPLNARPKRAIRRENPASHVFDRSLGASLLWSRCVVLFVCSWPAASVAAADFASLLLFVLRPALPPSLLSSSTIRVPRCFAANKPRHNRSMRNCQNNTNDTTTSGATATRFGCAPDWDRQDSDLSSSAVCVLSCRPLASVAVCLCCVSVFSSSLSCSRSRQITEFVKLNPTAQCVANGAGVADSTATYTLQLHTQSAGPLTLHVILGPLFPERPPSCQLTTHNSSLRLQHKYLDANGSLSLHPKLQPTQWSPHVNLGLIIQDLVRELTQQPPVLVNGAMPAFAASPAASYPGVAAQQQVQQQQHHMQLAQQHAQAHNSSPGSYMAVSPAHMHHPLQQPASQQPSPHSANSASSSGIPPIPRRPSLTSSPHASVSSLSSGGGGRTRPPDVPASFPELDGMSIAQLEDVLAEPAAVRDLAAEMDQVVQIEKVQREMVEKIESAAKANLAKRAQLEALASQLASEVTRLRDAQQLHASLLARHHASASRYSLPGVLSMLDASIAAAEEASEDSKTRYEAINSKAAAAGSAAGVAEDQQALEQYIKQRMTFHEQSAKKERLIETYGRQ